MVMDLSTTTSTRYSRTMDGESEGHMKRLLWFRNRDFVMRQKCLYTRWSSPNLHFIIPYSLLFPIPQTSAPGVLVFGPTDPFEG